MYVQSSKVFVCHSHAFTAAKALDILRALQGIGSAAIIPASVSVLLVVCSQTFDLAPAWNSSQGISAWTLAFDRVRHILCGRPDRRSSFSCSWWRPYTSNQVSPQRGFSQRFSISSPANRPTWRTPIFMFSGIAFAFMVLGFFVIEEDEPSTEDDQRVDWIGAALVTAGLVLIVFVLSDVPTAHKGWKSPRELFFFSVLLSVFHQRVDLRRRHHCPVRYRSATRTPLRRLAILLRAPAGKPGSSAYALDRSAAYEAINVDARTRSFRSDADDRLRELGRLHDMGSMGRALLPDVSEPKPDPHDASALTDVRFRYGRQRTHRFADRPRRRHVYRRHRHAHDRLRRRPLCSDRPTRDLLGFWLPSCVSHRPRRGLYVRVGDAVYR